MDTCKRAYTLVDATLAHYLSVAQDPDDPAVRQLCTTEGTNLDEVVTPLCLFIGRLIMGDAQIKKRFKDWILPTDLCGFFIDPLWLRV